MDFTFAAIDVGVTDKDRQLMLNEMLSIPDSYYSTNSFRGCRILHIYNGLGVRNKREGSNQGAFKYTDIEPFISNTKRILEEKVFPWMEPVGRINLLRTLPGHGLNVHLDSKAEEVGTRQHKYRIVLNGNIDKLYFLDAHGNNVYVPQCYNSYVLDGAHPHSLDPGTEEKITICFGKPWDGNPTPQYKKFIDNSLFTMKVSRPADFDQSWVDPYFNREKK
tara:strand:- start:47 stop:706 length:660 start_codon:yes stop_codon:yes gene_type:complete